MKTFVFTCRTVLPLLILSMISCFQSCKKTAETQPAAEEIEEMGRVRKPPFAFSNCSNPVFSGNFVTGSPANATITLNYVNGTGASYPAFTSARVNGITLTAPAGTLSTATGSIAFTASGTPIAAGNFFIPVSIGGSTCNLPIIVSNPQVPVSTGDPGAAVGSLGSISFTYQNQAVTYRTVRAADGKIWIQQNLGSPRFAVNSLDEASFGHFFQWGRWDDGHQLSTSATITASASLQNPSQVAPGNPAFIKNEVPAAAWWSGGLSGDTWNGNTATPSNGKNPCAALGAGWRMPTASEWQNIINLEGITDTYSAFRSNLKLPAGGARFFNTGVLHINGDIGYSWTSTADGSNAKALFIDNAYGLFISPTERGNGLPCRCLKD